MLGLLLPKLSLVIVIIVFPVLALLILGRARSDIDHAKSLSLFAALNVTLTFILFATASWHGPPKREWIYLFGPLCYFLAYLAAAMVGYFLLEYANNRGPRAWFVAYTYPLAALILVRFIFELWDPFFEFASLFSSSGSSAMFLGISYLAFRQIRLASEVRNLIVPLPTVSEYLCFAFFCPTMLIGPITTYSLFRKSLLNPDYRVTPLFNSFLRILKGLVKYLFLASLLSQISYTGLMLDGHQHGYVDLAIAAFAYYLFLYCNFSGFCDIVIGASGLAGIQVNENFQNPLASRNLQDFWNRWHMSLSFFMRDFVFTPMSKWFIRKLGARRIKAALVVPTLSVFILIGIWHGAGINYLLFGLTQGVGIVFVIYLGDAMRSVLGPEKYKAYLANPACRALAIATNSCYVSASFAFFATSADELRQILATLQ